MTINRKGEAITYTAMWLTVVALYLVDRINFRTQNNETAVDLHLFARMALTLLPYLCLFLVNNCLLIPRLLLRNRLRTYFVATAATLLLLWAYQFIDFISQMASMMTEQPPVRHRHHPLFPFPLLVEALYGLLVVGGNIAVALMFQRHRDQLEHERLLKASAQSQLTYLRAQINPHFYMNMLNNIHGMIEIDPEKAQSMVIDMSNLMRYMLYESPLDRLPLAKEAEFIRNYLRLMRLRYPADKVSISATYPSEESMAGVEAPPLIFLVFIENAFKHGISYSAPSAVDIALAVSRGEITFNCRNTIHRQSGEKQKEGIGLQNVTQRLELIYGHRFRLDAGREGDRYNVTLTIPADEA
ncbi:MAG: histidine kinase [Paramuribaculum sp.]|nr:histidine kinase [Paramuribaculum sp.]